VKGSQRGQSNTSTRPLATRTGNIRCLECSRGDGYGNSLSLFGVLSKRSSKGRVAVGTIPTASALSGLIRRRIRVTLFKVLPRCGFVFCDRQQDIRA
jgi:hypothetical protein